MDSVVRPPQKNGGLDFEPASSPTHSIGASREATLIQLTTLGPVVTRMKALLVDLKEGHMCSLE
jgi:hypothetical protein